MPDGAGELIPVVDDDEAVRNTLAALLSGSGYRAVCCADGVEAITRFNSQPNEVSLVITDVDMPNIGGALLARVVPQLRPDVRILAITGHAGDEVPGSDVHTAKRLAHGFLIKPFTPADLLATVHRLVRAAKT